MSLLNYLMENLTDTNEISRSFELVCFENLFSKLFLLLKLFHIHNFLAQLH